MDLNFDNKILSPSVTEIAALFHFDQQNEVIFPSPNSCMVSCVNRTNSPRHPPPLVAIVSESYWHPKLVCGVLSAPPTNDLLKYRFGHVCCTFWDMRSSFDISRIRILLGTSSCAAEQINPGRYSGREGSGAEIRVWSSTPRWRVQPLLFPYDFYIISPTINSSQTNKGSGTLQLDVNKLSHEILRKTIPSSNNAKCPPFRMSFPLMLCYECLKRTLPCYTGWPGGKIMDRYYFVADLRFACGWGESFH